MSSATDRSGEHRDPCSDHVADWQATGDETRAPPACAMHGAVRLGPGDHLEGRYRLLDLIGRGGMGEVWAGERINSDFAQRVAIKLLRHGRADADSRRRFRAERQLLATLQHPYIARLLDGGESADGTPYLVMEYVDGERIDVWCRQHALDLRARLGLFLDVLDAVQHAHGQLVVHRDIKPQNVLVDRDGRPRLLDFGIAKLIDPSDASTDTIDGEQRLTPRYASPEQINGEPVRIATDIYALGVLLYELLTGHSPYGDTGESPLALMKAICSADPQPASASVSADSGDTLGLRRDDLARMRLRLRGDLDHILDKCLRKEPAQRYPTAEALAADIRRFLDGYPVDARRGSTGYRVGKFVRRRWPLVAGTALLLAVVLGAVALQARQIETIRAERDRSEQLLAFVTGLFASADPSAGGGERVTVADAVGRVDGRLDIEVADPLVRARIRQAIADIYHGLGLHDRAGPLYAAAAAGYAALQPPDRARQALAISSRALVELELGDTDAAAASNAEAHTLQPAQASASDRATLRTHDALILVQQARYDEAEAAAQQALDLLVGGSDRQRLGTAWNNLGYVREAAGHFDTADSALRQALAIWDELHQQQPHPDTARTLSELGVTAWGAGQPQQAADWLQQALDMRRALLGPKHPDLALSLLNLAAIRNQLGDADESERMTREVWDLLVEAQGPQAPFAVTAAHNLGSFNAARDRLDEAALWYGRAWDVRRNMPETALERGYTASGYGDVECRRGHADVGLPLAEQGARILSAQLGADDWRVPVAEVRRAACLIAAGQPAPATALLDQVEPRVTDDALRQRIAALRGAITKLAQR